MPCLLGLKEEEQTPPTVSAYRSKNRSNHFVWFGSCEKLRKNVDQKINPLTLVYIETLKKRQTAMEE